MRTHTHAVDSFPEAARPIDGLITTRALRQAAPSSQLVIVDGMNHVLKTAPADPQKNYATYSDPSLPLAPAFVAALKDFLAGRLGGK